jgi:CHAD domain-containing protein
MRRPIRLLKPSVRSRRASAKHAPDATLSARLACDTAFRIIARQHLNAITTEHQGTCDGNPGALHRMRLAIASLRTSLRLFSPMLKDTRRPELETELKWLHKQLGAVRDLDVAIEQIAQASDEPTAASDLQSWSAKRAESHQLLTRALQSNRYHRLIQQISSWIESGPWSTQRTRELIHLRHAPLGDYVSRRLARWRKSLLRKSRDLADLGVKKRHRLRLLNKRLTYAVALLAGLSDDDGQEKQKRALKELRKAQLSLGQLNDDVRGRTLARELNGAAAASRLHFLRRRDQRRLLRKTVSAYKKLEKMKTLKSKQATPHGRPEA